MDNLEKLIGGAILLVLAFSGLIGVLDFVGLLPPWAARYLLRNKLEASLRAMKQLGVRACWDEDQQTLTIIQRALDRVRHGEPAYKGRLRALLDEDTYRGDFTIGETRVFTGKEFIDVMGGSASFSRCREYAQILNTHAADIRNFDIVATPKSGSPLLGYEYARLIGKPFVLGGSSKVRDSGNAMGPHVELDFPKALDLSGRTVLVVDDSTTGGRKVQNLIETLRAAGAAVTDVAVLFEPVGKGARKRLEEMGVRLHSVCEGPEGRF